MFEPYKPGPLEILGELTTGKRVAIVGNGPLKDGHAEEIETFDTVVRVNNFDRYVCNRSTRCDIHYSYFGRSIKPVNYKTHKTRLLVFRFPRPPFSLPDPVRWFESRARQREICFDWIYRLRGDLLAAYTPVLCVERQTFLQYFELLGQHMPTTGFQAVLDFDGLRTSELAIFGFDCFSSGLHNGGRSPWNQGGMNHPYGHVPEMEKTILEGLAESGKIEWKR